MMGSVVLTIALVAVIVLLFWEYLGYPIVVLLAAQGKRPPLGNEAYLPGVTIIIPAYNEARVIQRKLENTLELDYPRDKLQIIVVHDGDDHTPDVVKSFSHVGIELDAGAPRAGKAAAIDRGIRLARFPICVVTDANAAIDAKALKNIVPHFSDSKVGGVTGAMQQRDVGKTSVSGGGDLYWRYERLLRRAESQLHSVVSMSGELSVFRRELFLDDNAIAAWYIKGGTDDLQMTTWIIRRGYRVRYEDRAEVWEPAPTSTADLFQQKVRILVQTIITAHHNLGLLNRQYGWYGIGIFFTRRVLSLLTPWLLLFLLLGSVALWSSGLVWQGMLIGQLLFYGTALLGGYSFFEKISFFRVAHFFLLLHLTILIAWVQYFRRKDFTMWQKVESTR